MFLKNEDVKIGTIPDANGSDNPLKKMEFLTEYEVHPGDTTFTCDGAGHAIENIGDEDLVFMALILLDK